MKHFITEGKYRMGLFFLLTLCTLVARPAGGNGYNLLPDYVTFDLSADALILVGEGRSAGIYVDSTDWEGVQLAARNLVEDIYKVSGVRPAYTSVTDLPAGGIVIGTVGKSGLIDRLVSEGKIDVGPIRGQWESFLIQTVDNCLVIAGSDKRGTIYGIYDVSEKIGVSPWYYWADVPVAAHDRIGIVRGRYVQPSPKVKYRGIFLNDEWPSLGGWSKQAFGGFNSGFYGRLFELLLRLKANYLWPAMWDSAFYEDDPQNGELANKMGIVMGTSHHEPMMRAHKEYVRRRDQVGPWNYATNCENIEKFFREGVTRAKSYDNIITIGMRGDGDTAMGNGDDTENIRVLGDVVKAQRRIIEEVYGRKASEVPQLWAIFTEVQRYYDAGFTVPDDVTLLFCDNNWGQIRRTGPVKERKRKGGLGLYYHIDMNGGPASDRWVNTSPIPKLHEQLNLAYQTGIDRIWIINVGDLKPKELPIDFIMRYAWDPEAVSCNDLDSYLQEWAGRIFGSEYKAEIADIVSKYSKYNLMRKAEVQNPFIFSHVNHHESDRMLQRWHELTRRAEVLEHKLEPELLDAYYQLVLYPVKASAGVAEIYISAGKNNLYARQGRVSANGYADRAGVLFEQDRRLSSYYNDSMSGGKWKGMMNDNHIGYESWQIPVANKLPALEYVTPQASPAMGVAVEGSTEAWPGSEQQAVLPVFDVLDNLSYYIDVFNKGLGSFGYTAVADKDWICLDKACGTVTLEDRIQVSIDWDKLEVGEHSGTVTVSRDGVSVPVTVRARKYDTPNVEGHYFGSSGEFSIPACSYNRKQDSKDGKSSWIFAPDLGRGEGCMRIEPVTVPSAKATEGPVLEYDVFLPADTDVKLALGILPTQDVYPERGLRMAVAIDGGAPQMLDMRKGMIDEFREYTADNLKRAKNFRPLPAVDRNFKQAGYGMPRRNDVFDCLRWVDVALGSQKSGMHTLKVYMIDPEIVLEKIIVNPDNEHPSYDGKPAIVHTAKGSERIYGF